MRPRAAPHLGDRRYSKALHRENNVIRLSSLSSPHPHLGLIESIRDPYPLGLKSPTSNYTSGPIDYLLVSFSMCGMFFRKHKYIMVVLANHRRADRFNVRRWLERMRKRHSGIRERAFSTQRSQQDTFGERYLIRGVCSSADSRPKRKLKVAATRCAFSFDPLQCDQIRIVGIPCQVAESRCESRTGDCLAILGR